MERVDIVLADATTLRDGILYDKKAIKELYERLSIVLKKNGKIYIQDGFTKKKPFILDLNRVIGEVYSLSYDEASSTLSITEIVAKNISVIENSESKLRISFKGKITPTSSFRNEELSGILERVDETFYMAMKD
jgi:hypothetical protein